MKNIFLLIIVLAAILIGSNYWKNYKGAIPALIPSQTISNQKQADNQTGLPLTIPNGYSISIYAKDLGNPRDLALDPSGNLLASITGQGKVVAIVNGQVVTVTGGLREPHGLAFSANKLFIAETSDVATYDYDSQNHKATNKKKIIDLPGGGRHFTRSLLIKDNKLYVAIGSDCDTCIEKDARRAAIWVANLDGSDFKAFATGLRNSVFLTLNPKTNDIWATEMGRDFLGDNLPPDEINIVKEGNFGWPICYGKNIHDTQFDKNAYIQNPCTEPSEIPSHIDLPAHSAPLGLAFLGDSLLVSYHGSWNRTAPTGYKVVKISLDKNGNEMGKEDFVSGWLTPDGKVLGRPADILVKGKEIYISDDKSGVIYLLRVL